MQKRKQTRLKNYDYSQNGAYFVTICLQNKQKLLWRDQSVSSSSLNQSPLPPNQSVGASFFAQSPLPPDQFVGARTARPHLQLPVSSMQSPLPPDQFVGARIARPQSLTPLTPTTQLSNYGIIIDDAINAINKHYPTVNVDKYVIMPNHIHMIIMLSNEGGRAMRAPTVSVVINQMKGFITKQIGYAIWQKLFYDHIIRNQVEYNEIWNYIDTNPLKWEDDCFFV